MLSSRLLESNAPLWLVFPEVVAFQAPRPWSEAALLDAKRLGEVQRKRRKFFGISPAQR